MTLPDLLERQRAAFLRDGFPDAATRRGRLRALERVLFDRRDDIAGAVSADFGQRSPAETLGGEVTPTLRYSRYLRRRLGAWMRPAWRPADLHSLFARAHVVPQPLGVVGVMSAWNYPVMLSLMPVSCALAAGNRVLLKVSEQAPRTGALLAEMMAAALPPEVAGVVQGGPEVGEEFSRLPFDHLFFTGSTVIGRKVAQAAAANLVPVTLELGGKSPAIVESAGWIEFAAERVAFGRYFNAGQSCVAVDYALVPRGQGERFARGVAESERRLRAGRMAGNLDTTTIVNQRHFDRLRSLVDEARSRGARVLEIFPDEPADPASRLFPGVVLLGATSEMRVMKEEIFGPILPVMEVDSLDAAIDYVNARPRPLTLHWFGGEKGRKQVERRTVSGQLVANDVLWHFVQRGLRFGGVGESGMGAYHGREGFFTFSHHKSVFVQPRWNPVRLFRPPFPGSRWKKAVLEFFLRF